MSLAAALERESEASTKGPQCSIGRILDALDDVDQSALISSLHGSMLHTAIARALTSNDHRVSASTVARHRRGDCSCDAR